jgi:hypothetical protein
VKAKKLTMAIPSTEKKESVQYQVTQFAPIIILPQNEIAIDLL